MLRATLFATLILTPSLARAATIDFTSTLSATDGKPFMECKEPSDEGEKCKRTGPVTLGEVAVLGLSLPDHNIPLDEQVRRGRLAMKVVDGKSVDLTADEIKTIKDQVAKVGLSPVLTFDAVRILDPAAIKD